MWHRVSFIPGCASYYLVFDLPVSVTGGHQHSPFYSALGVEVRV